MHYITDYHLWMGLEAEILSPEKVTFGRVEGGQNLAALECGALHWSERTQNCHTRIP